MKIAVLVNELNIRGGTHKQVLRLCEYLESQRIEFKIFTKYYDPLKTYPDFRKYNPVSLYSESDDYTKKHSLLKKIQSNIRFFSMIYKDFDIVNAHDYGLYWPLFLTSMKKSIITVWQINDLPGCFKVGVNKKTETTIKDKLNRKKYRYLAKKIDAITGNVTKNKERVEMCMGKKATVLYCGVDVNANLRKHTYIPSIKNEIRLLSTGVFFPYRNYETLVLVIKQLRNEGYNAWLDIIGSTELSKDYANSVINLIIDKNLKKYIKIWGQVDESTYNMLYNRANIFAFINIDQSWGLTVFEAMSAGIPTIVSNSVGAIELLHDGEDSIIVEPKNVSAISDTIKRLVSDGEYYNKISNNAYEIVKEFSWDKLYSSKLVEIFEKLVNYEKQSNHKVIQ